MKLSAPAEEVATFFAKMLDHEYTTKDIFRKNFFKDWRKVRGATRVYMPPQGFRRLETTRACFKCLSFYFRK